MSTNAYDYSEKIVFDPKDPTEYFGWYISTSSSELKVAHFKNPDLRRQMEKEVQALIPEARADVLAPCSLIMSISGSDNDSDFARDMALDQISGLFDDDDVKDGKWEALRAIGDKYSTIE
jgi:hypothetical protein